MKKIQNKGSKLSSSGVLMLLGPESRVLWIISDMLAWSLGLTAS
jgi:hypothetical protein